MEKSQKPVIAILGGIVVLLAINIGISLRSRSVVITPETLPPIPTREDIAVVMNSSREAPTLQARAGFDTKTAAPGQAFLICNLTVTNKGADPLEFKGYRVRLHAGTTSQLGYGAGGDIYTNAKILKAIIPPGGVATGDVAFNVTPGTKPERFSYDLVG